MEDLCTFMKSRGVTKQWRDWITCMGNRTGRMLNRQMDYTYPYPYIADWDTEFAEIQEDEIDKYLKKDHRINSYLRQWVMSREQIRTDLANSMQYNDATRKLEITDDQVTSLEKRRISEFLSRKGMSEDWIAWIMSNEETWSDLHNIMEHKNPGNYSYIDNWGRGVLAGLQKKVVSECLESNENVSNEKKAWIMSVEAIWRELATSMKYDDATSNLEITQNQLADLNRKERIYKFLSEKKVLEHWTAWILSHESTWRNLFDNIFVQRNGGIEVNHNADWDATFADLKRQMVRRFLDENRVEQGWQDFFMEKETVWNALAYSICKLDSEFIQQGETLHPSRDSILTAFRLCPKSELKVILFGEDPRKHEATGLAFSYTEGSKESDHGIHPGSAVQSVHRVLRALLKENHIRPPKAKDTSYCHSDWAEGGVLLLNAALTYTHKQKSDKTTHQAVWSGFMKSLMIALLTDPEQAAKELYVLFWGSVPNTICKDLEQMGFPYSSCHRFCKGPHPTERRGNFKKEASKHLTDIAERWPGLFTLKEDSDKNMIGLANMFESLTV